MNGAYKTQLPNLMAAQNDLLKSAPSACSSIDFHAFQAQLPSIRWDGHKQVEALYEHTWQLAHQHLRHPTPENGFLSSFIDTAFNDCTFMWDSVFIVLFAKYARGAYDFAGMLDNFYAKQAPDGFICREIGIGKGEDRFAEHDPTSTGPNLLAWCEWELYLFSGDVGRLRRVFPVLCAYHRWTRLYRSWPDGSYWSTGWGCGLDNSPRFEKDACLNGFDHTSGFDFFHGFNTWLDATVHAALSGQCLMNIARRIGREHEIQDIADEAEMLAPMIRERLWDERIGLFTDLSRDGAPTGVGTIVAYWTLVAGIASPEQASKLIDALRPGGVFFANHRVPSLSTLDPHFSDDPVYWQGGTWACTNYMVLKALQAAGEHELAREIALETLDNALNVYGETGTLWEYYNPNHPAPGAYAKRDFVGWTGLIPTAILMEFVFGIRIDAERREIHWRLATEQRHGVTNLPLFGNGTLSMLCEPESEGGQLRLTIRIEPARGTERESQPIRLIISGFADRQETIETGGSAFEYCYILDRR